MLAVLGAVTEMGDLLPTMVKNPRSGDAPFLSAARGIVKRLLGEVPSNRALALVVDAGRVRRGSRGVGGAGRQHSANIVKGQGKK